MGETCVASRSIVEDGVEDGAESINGGDGEFSDEEDVVVAVVQAAHVAHLRSAVMVDLGR